MAGYCTTDQAVAARTLTMHLLLALVSALLAVSARTSTTKRNRGPLPRVVNGQDAAVGQFPHQALVVIGQRSVCGGSLISKASVLTAAHCTIAAKKYTIRLGGIHQREDEDTAWITVSTWAKAYPDFNTTSSSDNDVSIIFLTDEPPLSPVRVLVLFGSSFEVAAIYVMLYAVCFIRCVYELQLTDCRLLCVSHLWRVDKRHRNGLL
ncbi:vitellin-degrading protease-like [Schistocerca americana]|uniref:vitellin-degrading protease-like n=1 Tax=Schistocerca americana TaxID=7009 RepID=UPI001F4F5DEE|nr:vitellin-degrading protease-like [Schistocerca americana]